MDFRQELQKLLQENQENTLPSISLDLVILGLHESQLKVLLLRFKESNAWLLPAGRIRKEEDLDDAVARSLRERTGLEQLFLQPFNIFGKVNRLTHLSEGETLAQLGLADLGFKPSRDISLGYYALVEYTKVHPMPDSLSDACRWWDIEEVPPLLFDQNDMIRLALKTLRRQLSYQPIGYKLLPEQFTMAELQSLYETILGRSLNRGNFYKQIVGYDILERLEKRPTIPSSKAPYLYRFNKERYEQLLSEEDLSIG